MEDAATEPSKVLAFRDHSRVLAFGFGHDSIPTGKKNEVYVIQACASCTKYVYTHLHDTELQIVYNIW